ncbi:diaminopimelate epimerase [Abyssisolibacter fermentans]|uniref:diaminopimelate epimerase n=1 Tax=Abyssisolibacter fermentans TaxID=1766203 RepID=UPI0008297BE9|nr:diaminopimelate epimerase [Abyssisolibacter fermentans]
MNIEFTKLQGLGNDFIVIDNRIYNFSTQKLSTFASRLCTRKLSIGADGLMAVDTATTSNADFKMRFYNSDGSIGEMCGNGARCIARYAFVNNITSNNMSFETTAGIVHAQIQEGRLVKVQLNNPDILDLDRTVTIDDNIYNCSYIELGNPGVPHAVVKMTGLNNTATNEIFDLGKALRYDNVFPKGANINFYDIVDDTTAIVKTYERGVEDFTLACGTGSASVAIALILKNILKSNNVKIIVPGGELFVNIERNKLDVQKVYLIGNTNIVCKGVITDEELLY